MKRAISAKHHTDPFPENLKKPDSVNYISDLTLVRFYESLKTATGHDALYIVGRDYTLQYSIDGVTHHVIVPMGMLTDLASVPRFARWFVERVGKHLEAAIVHDFLYVAHKWEKDPQIRKKKRKFADDMFLVGIRESGVGIIKSYIMYFVIRLLGRYFSENNTDQDFLDISDPKVLARLHCH